MKITALLAMMVLAHTAFAGGRVALTLLAAYWGWTPFEVGLMLSLLAVFPMLLSVHAGRWTDRRGIVRPIVMALLMLEAALLLALLPAIIGLGMSAVLLGCGFMLVHLAINTAVGHGSNRDKRTSAFSTLALGASVSTAAGPVLAGFLIDSAGFQLTFLTLALLPLLALVLLGLARHHALPASPIAPTAAGRRLSTLLQHKPLRVVLVTSAILSMGLDLFTFMVPMHGNRVGLSASSVGLIMGSFGAGTFAVRLFISPLSARFSEWKILAGALAVTATVYVLFPLFRAVPMLMALAFVLGLGLGSAFPTIMSAIQHTAPIGRRGEAIGVRTMLINASQFALPMSFGGLGSVAGTEYPFWILAGVLGSGAVYALRQDRPEKSA